MEVHICEICMSDNALIYLDIFGEANCKKNISTVITKHLWFTFEPNNKQQVICNECWNTLNEFNNFYDNIAKIHRNLEKNILKEEILDDLFGDSVLRGNHNNDNESSEHPIISEKKFPGPSNLDTSISREVEGSPNESFENCATRTTEEQKKAYEQITTIKPQVETQSASMEYSTKRTGRYKAKTVYKAESSSEDMSNNFSDLDEVDFHQSITNVPRKRARLEDTDFAKSDTNESESEANAKPIRAKRKKDPRLFEHIKEFICYHCPEKIEFDRFYHATLHYREFHKEPAYIKCRICDKRCYSPGSLISHMEVHKNPDVYKCQICGKVNDEQVSLAKHMRLHRSEIVEDLPYECSRCLRRFSSEKRRDRHEKDHDRKRSVKPTKIVGRDEELLEFYRRIICDICEQQRPVNDIRHETEYDNLLHLKKHMREEHDDKGYLKCHMCDKKCYIRSMLLIHKDFHLNQDKFRCEICGNVYQNLEKHKETAHAAHGEALFCCEHCGKALTNEKSLKSHVERKHAVKDTICDICQKPFHKSMLESHKRVVHEMASYMCTKCPRMFRSMFSLNRHLDEHENKVRERVKCSLCGMTFKHKYILRKHIGSVHTTEAPVSCDVCGKQFKSKHHLWSHKSDTCNNRRFACTICGRVFKVKVRLNEHMTTHTGKSLYQCTFCPLTFSFQSILYTHRKKAHYEQWLELQAKREEGVKFKVLEAPA
ncbi:zinc finger protein 83-like [Wyeomyia smithii]|uniref:zinc finger protein 83-like n=1 Tax=Wyeomyia smithii TaxID=174621 RepID=UPI002467EF9A|nr:zinc finger protein 83-like [Wyeomyia smithii]